MAPRKKSFLRRHSLSLIAAAFVVAWIVLYALSDPTTRTGAFFGNAIADWSGTVVVVFCTKFLYERGSAESKRVPRGKRGTLPYLLEEHSLTIFLVITGAGWLLLYLQMNADSKWGQVVGNILSAWVQLIGLVLLTKKFFESGSHER